MGMRYLVKKSTICGLQKYRSSSPSSIKGQNYCSLPRSWLQYHLLKIVRDWLHFINYRRIKKKTSSVLQGSNERANYRIPRTVWCLRRFYDDFKCDPPPPPPTSANLRYVKSAVIIRIHKVNCMWYLRLSFSFKRLRFLTAAWFRRENTAIFTANARKSQKLITCSITWGRLTFCN